MAARAFLAIGVVLEPLAQRLDELGIIRMTERAWHA